MSKINWPPFRRTITETLATLRIPESEEQLEEAVTNLTTTITNSLEAAAESRRQRHIQRQQIPDEVLQLVDESAHLRRNFDLSRDPGTKLEITRTTRTIRTKMMEEGVAKWEAVLSQGSRRFIGSLEAEAEWIAEAFEEYHQLPPSTPEARSLDRRSSPGSGGAKNRRKRACQIPSEAAGSLPRSKTPSIQENSRSGRNFHTAAKNLPRKAVAFLTMVVNGMLKLGYFPKQWKRALVVPVRKPGKARNKVTSYRSIFLLLSKVAEKVVLPRGVEIIAGQEI